MPRPLVADAEDGLRLVTLLEDHGTAFSADPLHHKAGALAMSMAFFAQVERDERR